MTVLITGGNGFVGKHLIKVLNEAKISYLAPRSSELNVLDFQAFSNYLSNHKPDTILAMAALCGGILANKNRPADFLFVNTQMALNIYEAARINNIKRVYSLGSVCAYPKNCPVPFKEDDIWKGYPEETNAPYGIAKRTLMTLGQTYREQYGIGGAHLIPVNLYGEHDHFDLINSHVIPALIRKFKDAKFTGNDTVKCWGTGAVTREFLYVGDAAEAIVKAVLTGFDSSLPINLGTGQDISIENLAKLIARLTDYKDQIKFESNGLDGQPKRKLDVSRAKELLGWTAKTSLEEGLRRTIDWYRDPSSGACE